MAEVERLRSMPQPSDGELPPFDITIVVNLAGERQIHLRSPVTEPIAPAEANRRTDALMQVVERQRSMIEIRVLEDELTAKNDALDKVWRVRKAEAEAKLEADLTGVENDIAKDMAKQEQLKHAANDHAAQTGRNTVRLEGAAKKEHDTLARAIVQHRARVATIQNEHKQFVQTIDGNIEKLEADIREISRQLERHRKIVG